jgi:hypothetical protein
MNKAFFLAFTITHLFDWLFEVSIYTGFVGIPPPKPWPRTQWIKYHTKNIKKNKPKNYSIETEKHVFAIRKTPLKTKNTIPRFHPYPGWNLGMGVFKKLLR